MILILKVQQERKNNVNVIRKSRPGSLHSKYPNKKRRRLAFLVREVKPPK